MTHRVTLIVGDTTGPEVAAATKRLIAAAGVQIEWVEAAAGKRAFDAEGTSLPEATLAAIRDTKVALKGKLSAPVGTGYVSPNVALRKALDLYAVVRPIRSQPGFTSRYENVDLLIVREATEDVYSGIEQQIVPGVVQSIKVTSRAACERIIHKAFALARTTGKTKVTLAHKANIMKKADGLFLQIGREIAAQNPDIAFEAVIADNACMQLVRRPEQYQVIVAQGLFGDLISDLAAGLVGGRAQVSGTLEGDSDLKVFEAIYAAPAANGEASANPLPLIRAAVELLHHLGESIAASRIENAIAICANNKALTPDLGGNESTESFVDALIAKL